MPGDLADVLRLALGLQGGNSLRIETLYDQPDAQRKLEYRDRKCAQSCQGATLRGETEDHGNVSSDEYGRSDDSDHG